MTLSPRQNDELADLPVLTEAVDTGIDHIGKNLGAGIPTLTEIIAEEVTALVAQTAPANLPDMDCQHLATQIAPQLETLLRNNLAARFDALWQEVWRETQTSLPELIQAQLAAQQSVIEAMQNNPNSVRAELVEACPEPVEVTHSPFDKLRVNGLQTSSGRINSNTAGSDNSTSAHPPGVGRGCTADESATTTHSADSGLPAFGIIAPFSAAPTYYDQDGTRQKF